MQKTLQSVAIMDPEEYKNILRYLENGKYPEILQRDKNLKRNFRRKLDPFSESRNELFYNTKKGPCRVVKEEEKDKILSGAHEGHLGVQKT